jgi:hypothetical protein
MNNISVAITADKIDGVLNGKKRPTLTSIPGGCED